MGYFRDTIKGLFWMGGLRFTTRVFSIVRIAILARILSPAQFGIFTIGALALAFLETFTETGINIFLIQEKASLKKHVNTAWTVSIVRGFLIFIIIFISAPLFAAFFNSPQSAYLLRLISLVALLRGFINPSIVRFQKDLQFNKEFWFRGLIFFLDSTVAIILAFITRSATSLVWGLIAGVVLEIFLSFLFVRPRPKLVFEFQRVKKIVRRGKWLTFAGIFNYLSNEGDDAIVGKILGSSSLGLYRIAFKISSLPLTEVTAIARKVVFPVYVRISGDSARLKKAFIKTVLSVSVLVIPIGLIFFLFPRQLILIILGENWVGATGVLRVLALSGVIRAITGSTGALFYALKLQKYATSIAFFKLMAIAVSIIPLTLKYGITGAGISVLAGSIITIPAIIYYLKKVF
jgi:O-antigen/teichoic acid export membrane protein